MSPEMICMEIVLATALVNRIDRKIGRTDFGDLGLVGTVSSFSPSRNSSIFEFRF